MTYFEELRANWRPLLAAMIGLSTGFTALAFTNSIMGPYLLRAFGWSKADFALLGMLGLMTLVGLPIAGRLVDRFDVRRTALVGFVTGPISFLALSRMSGDFQFYIAVVVIQNLLCMTTTSTVFTRTVVQHIHGARGMALAIAASGPAVTIAVAGPMLNNFITAHGWRAGYIALAFFTAIGGFIAIALVPPRRAAPARIPPAKRKPEGAYRMLVRMPAFWILFAGITLSNVSQFITNTQLGVVLQAYDVSPQQISGMISIFAVGILVGRFACGLALDRFPAPVVATVVMAMPPIGQFLIAANFDAAAVLTGAVLLIGLSYGAEGDLIGYLVARSFGIRIYGTVLGLMAASISLGSAGGSLLLSMTLKGTGGYGLFLVVSGILALTGSLLFLLLPKPAPPEAEAADHAIAASTS
ncbi:Predicted arabinose efflux permease, MFS family [Novosphingobium sp. CF614]|uniref:MFS transporter n=1 Tax=Novosphingobium sp. CF614 TaxID=1884364 RepID=UPI0008DFED4B|nr:MFS transporter [Novosphingobium sp. CF614]SFF77264.1 Predicted arabinose efflux permease, MFS family [Novosphingobium sp. CF614]